MNSSADSVRKRSATIFANATIMLPDRRFAKGDVVVEDGVIAAVRLEGDEGAPVAGAVSVDCDRRLLMPGLVNCHGHTAMTLLRGVGAGLPLKRWLEEAIFPVEARMCAEDVRAGTALGAMEMLAGGTTAVADMYDFPAAAESSFSEAGIKVSINRVGLAFADDVPPGRLGECVEYVARGCEGRINRDFCIHSEYLTNEKFCRELAAANRDFRRPVHLHVSETLQEHEECIRRHGKTPIAYLADTGLLDFGAYAAHCVFATDDDFRIMREKGVSLVHNPTSNMKLGSGFARIPEAIAAGVNVALGTDGCASNDNLNLFEEMHLVALVHKGIRRDPTVLTAWDVLEMATVNGARALGRTDTGEIAPGKKADFCIIDLDRTHLEPCRDLAALIVYSMQASDVAMTVVDGEILYENGQFMRLDPGRVKFEFLQAVRRLGL